MLRFLLRVLFSMMLFLLGRLLGPRGGGGQGPGGRSGDRGSDPPRGGARRAKGPPPLDRSDVVDVPFTEISQPSDPASGAAGRS